MADFAFSHSYLSVEAIEGSEQDLTTSVQSSITSSTKGSYVELIASTTQEYHGLIVYGRKDANDSATATDIAIGSAGNEEILLPDFAITGYKVFAESSKAFIPVYIPAGSRISARTACFIGLSPAYIHLVGVAASGGGAGGGIVTTYGRGADFSGTFMDSSTSTNTKGSWYELTASTTADIRQLIYFMGKFSNTADSDASFLVDIGIGGAGSEEIIVANQLFASNSSEKLNGGLGVAPIYIPKGTRIAARCQSSINVATDRAMSISIMGVS